MASCSVRSSRLWGFHLRHALLAGVLLTGSLTGQLAWAADADSGRPTPPVIPAHIQGKEGVKTYLVTVAESVLKASHDLKAAGVAYEKLLASHDNDAVKAAAAQPEEVARLIKQMRSAYERIDSYGFEYIEGIVAGVSSLAKYDVELDSGLPKSMAGPDDEVAQVVIHAGDLKLNQEGSLNNFLIEPTVFGTNEKFTVGKAQLPGLEGQTGLPHAKLVIALADYAIDGYTRLLKDSKAWTPSDQDCFEAIHAMTPTLADYFEEWKESKIAGSAQGGRFVAVSRISDMRGIMSSVRLTWQSLEPQVKARDAALADSISQGYEHIMLFIDTIDARDKKKPLTAEAIDALGSQARERADKLTVQAAQAAALMNITLSAQ